MVEEVLCICNGSSKTGSHLLLKAVSLFYGHIGLPQHEHTPYFAKRDDRKYLHITRNPRNVLISWCRFMGIELTDENLLEQIPIIIDEMREYVPWLGDTEVLNVKFEELLDDPKHLDRISEFINMPLVANHFENLWGRTYTFTGRLSDWRDYWSDELQESWVKFGGLKLEADLGYRN